MGDHFGGLAVNSAGELALDALFGSGVEGDRHGGSIRRRDREWVRAGGANDPPMAMRLP